MLTPSKVGFGPIAQEDAKVLILGSLPGEMSLAQQRYYAHPRNQFWQLVGGVIGENLSAVDYEDRVDLLVQHKIALWDVVAQGRRHGSLDATLKPEKLTDAANLACALPTLRAIAFNGGKAATLGLRAFAHAPYALLQLPSSSPAYTLPVPEKLAAWRALAAFL